MKKIFLSVLMTGLVVGFLVVPAISSAQVIPTAQATSSTSDPGGLAPDATVQSVTTITQMSDVQDLVIRVVKWIQVFFFVIATAFIIMTAFTYLTSKGEAEKITEAKKSLVYALIAIAVALLASGMRALVYNFLGGA